MVLGRGKLRLSAGAIRAFVAALAASVSLCVITIPAVFAQDAPPDVSAGETPAPGDDPIAAAERALVLETAETPTSAAPAVSTTGTVLRMVLTLAAAAAAIYGVIYFIKRASRRAETRDPFLKVLASAPLGSNRYAHIIAVGTKAWLVGAAESGVHLIGEIEDKDTLNALFLEDCQKRRSPGRAFPGFQGHAPPAGDAG